MKRFEMRYYWTNAKIRRILEYADWRLNKKPHCHWCKATGVILTCDHVIPKAHGGVNHPANCVLACKPCNNKRGREMVDEARRQAGFEIKRRHGEQVRAGNNIRGGIWYEKPKSHTSTWTGVIA